MFRLLETCSKVSNVLENLQVTVELKNDLAITGTLHSVDQFLNIKLTNTRVVNEAKFPHMVSTYSTFLLLRIVRYVEITCIPRGSAY